MNWGKPGFFDNTQFNFLHCMMRILGPKEKKLFVEQLEKRGPSFSMFFSLPPSLEDSTCFKLSARNTMYTQQKPIWVTIRKKLTIRLKERRERKRKKLVIKEELACHFHFCSQGLVTLDQHPRSCYHNQQWGSRRDVTIVL